MRYRALYDVALCDTCALSHSRGWTHAALGTDDAAGKVLRTYDLSQVEPDDALHFRCDVQQLQIDARRLNAAILKRTVELNMDEINLLAQSAQNTLSKVRNFTLQFARV